MRSESDNVRKPINQSTVCILHICASVPSHRLRQRLINRSMTAFLLENFPAVDFMRCTVHPWCSVTLPSQARDQPSPSMACTSVLFLFDRNSIRPEMTVFVFFSIKIQVGYLFPYRNPTPSAQYGFALENWPKLDAFSCSSEAKSRKNVPPIPRTQWSPLGAPPAGPSLSGRRGGGGGVWLAVAPPADQTIIII